VLTNSIDDAAWAGKKEASVWVKHYNAAQTGQHRALVRFYQPFWWHGEWLVSMLHACMRFDLCSIISHERLIGWHGARGPGRQVGPGQFIGNPCLRKCRAKATRISMTTQATPDLLGLRLSAPLYSSSKRNISSSSSQNIQFFRIHLSSISSSIYYGVHLSLCLNIFMWHLVLKYLLQRI
jgi:hypothetical protein